MNDPECVRFLQWCLPRLGLRWRGYRKVRRTVCKRISRRLRALGLRDLNAYRALLGERPEEWKTLLTYCGITISRFCRDRQVFECLGSTVLPRLAARTRSGSGRAVTCWSAGCASGEEVYSVKLTWNLLVASRFSELELRILGTDVNPSVIERARAACYERGSLRDAPTLWMSRAFERSGETWCLRPEYRKGIRFLRSDLLDTPPDGRFDLVLCRNLAFTYFAAPVQLRVLRCLTDRLRDGGALVLGAHETLPDQSGYRRLGPGLPIYERVRGSSPSQANPTI
jgi:chemotaxis protein methyltransferase CheR